MFIFTRILYLVFHTEFENIIPNHRMCKIEKEERKKVNDPFSLEEVVSVRTSSIDSLAYLNLLS